MSPMPATNAENVVRLVQWEADLRYEARVGKSGRGLEASNGDLRRRALGNVEEGPRRR